MMREELKNLLRTVACIVLASGALLTTAVAGANDTDRSSTVALIENLTDDSYVIREAASSELWSMGDAALPALQKVAQGGDPEAADRARELILYIQLQVLPSSSDELKSLVLMFSRGSSAVKIGVLKKLHQLGHWRQVIFLAQLEKNEDIQEQIYEVVRKTAIRAAAHAVVERDYKLAQEVLNLGGSDENVMMVKAWFYVRQGLYEQELKKAMKQTDESGGQWRLALYRASGDLDSAIREAKLLGRNELVAMLQVLAGDAVPWLNFQTDNDLQDEILTHSCEIQMARLAGDESKAQQLVKKLILLATDKGSEERVITGLAANGYSQEALKLLERSDASVAFDYYDRTESPERALAVFGISPEDKPPYAKWVKKTTSQMLEDENEDGYEQILMLAGFLVKHGEGEHAMAVVEPLMTALKDDGSDLWFELIGKMSDYDLYLPALELLAQRGNDDSEADLGVQNLLDSGKSVTYLWGILKKRNPKNISQSLYELALLAGLIPDSARETDVLHKALFDEVADQPAADRELRYEALFSFALKRHEVGVASEMVDGFVNETDRWKKTKLFLDTALLRWGVVESAYADFAKKSPSNYVNLVKWAVVLRKLGKLKKGQEVLDRALMVSMGEVSKLHIISNMLSDAGYAQEAHALRQNAAMMADTNGSDFDRIIVYLVSNLPSSHSQLDWKKSAALAEAYSRFSMRGSNSGDIIGVLNARSRADFTRGMSLLVQSETGGYLKDGEDRARALKLLDSAYRLSPGGGVLADDFFPHLRNLGLDDRYDEWFEKSYQHLDAACQLYPKAHNSHNTTAWLAARAVRRLDDGLRHAKIAVGMRPTQGAYLDTMAEVYFSRGERELALKWSRKAIDASISHAQGFPRSERRVLGEFRELHKQYDRFKNDPLPSENR